MIPDKNRQILLGKDTSRLNKIHLAIGWTRFRGWYIDYRWVGVFLRSRLEFQFAPDGLWYQAQSFDEDVFVDFK